MGKDYYPLGQSLTMPFGKFNFYQRACTVGAMQTIHDTRRQRLEILISEAGSIAKLNEELKWPRADSRISRIKNANARTDRGGKVFQMGDSMAREIEDALGKPTGWMDTPPTYAELHGEPDPISKVVGLMEAMQPEARYQALRLLDALAQPSPANGTTGQQ